MAFQTNRLQIDGSLNVDGSIFQNGVEFIGGGTGGGGDVAWASGSVGSDNQLITAAGDGSIVAESNLTFTGGNTLNVTGTVSATTFSGAGTSLTGTATSLNIGGNAATATTSEKTSKVWVDISDTGLGSYGLLWSMGGGDVSIYQSSWFFINRNTKTLYATNFDGALNGTAANATNVGVADESTDTTCYPLFVTNNTGNLPPKVGSNLTFNSNTGALTATSFSGTGSGLTSLNAGNISSGTLLVNRGGTGATTFTADAVLTGNTTSAIQSESDLIFDATGLRIKNSGTENIRLTRAGQIDAEGDIVAYSSIVSDIRLKENIIPLESSLDKILKLDGVSYDRKNNGDRHIGFIAQEVEKIIPEVIHETPLPLQTGDEETIYKTIRYTEMIPYLVESIKEQQKIINAQQKEINELKDKTKYL